MFVEPAPHTHVSVRDSIKLNADRSVILERMYRFETSSEAPQRVIWQRSERLGNPFRGSLSAEGVHRIQVIPSSVEDDLPFYWKIDGETTEPVPLVATVSCELLPASADHPLQYQVIFDPANGVSYSVRLTAAYPRATESSRFRWSAEPSVLNEALTLTDGGELVTRGSVTISANRTGPAIIDFHHEEQLGLASTALMRVYAERFR